MDVNFELLQFYAYKKLIKRKDIPSIIEESKKHNTTPI